MCNHLLFAYDYEAETLLFLMFKACTYKLDIFRHTHTDVANSLQILKALIPN